MSNKRILVFGIGAALDDCDRWDYYVNNTIQKDLGPEFIGAQWYGATLWDSHSTITCTYQHNIFGGF